jgi:hypothetical protein
MTEQEARGDIKYLASGDAVQVVTELDQGYLILRVYDIDEEDEPFIPEDRYEIVPQVFDRAPTARLDERLASLREEITRLEDQHRAIMLEITTVKAEEAERLTRYQQYKALAQLDLFLSGKITHYVVCQDYVFSAPSILTVDETKAEYSRHHNALKLLTLHGDSEGNLAWRLNHYADGSGSSTTVIPATSYDEALQVLGQYMLDKIDIARPHESFVQAAQKYSVALPVEYIEALKKQQLQIATAQVEVARKKLVECEANLITAQGA